MQHHSEVGRGRRHHPKGEEEESSSTQKEEGHRHGHGHRNCLNYDFCKYSQLHTNAFLTTTITPTNTTIA